MRCYVKLDAPSSHADVAHALSKLVFLVGELPWRVSWNISPNEYNLNIIWVGAAIYHNVVLGLPWLSRYIFAIANSRYHLGRSSNMKNLLRLGLQPDKLDLDTGRRTAWDRPKMWVRTWGNVKYTIVDKSVLGLDRVSCSLGLFSHIQCQVVSHIRGN